MNYCQRISDKTCLSIKCVVHFANNNLMGCIYDAFSLSHWCREVRVGCGLSIKVNAGLWLAGSTNPPSALHGNSLRQYFSFKKTEPRYWCPITVQTCREIFVLHTYKLWVTSLCERRSYDSVKSEETWSWTRIGIFPINFDHKGQTWQDSIPLNSYFVMKMQTVYFKTAPVFLYSP